MALDIVLFSGSIRKGSLNGKLADHLTTRVLAHGAQAQRISLSDYPLPIYDGDLEADTGVPAAATALMERFARADGIVVASPEYNAGYAPLLKNAIDWMSRISIGGGSVFREKPILIASATPGALGGLRGLLSLRQTLEIGLGAYVVPTMVMVGGAGDAFEGDALKPGRSFDFAEQALSQFLAVASALPAKGV